MNILVMIFISVAGSVCSANDFDQRWNESEAIRKEALESRLWQEGRVRAAEHLAAIPRFARMMRQTVVEGSTNCDPGDVAMNHGAYYTCDFKTQNLNCRVKSASAGFYCGVANGRTQWCEARKVWYFRCVDGNNQQIRKALPWKNDRIYYR